MADVLVKAKLREQSIKQQQVVPNMMAVQQDSPASQTVDTSVQKEISADTGTLSDGRIKNWQNKYIQMGKFSYGAMPPLDFDMILNVKDGRGR